MEKQNIVSQIDQLLVNINKIDENISFNNDNSVAFAEFMDLQYNYIKKDLLKQLSKLLKNSNPPINFYNKELEEILSKELRY